jgi:hypothetical protein
MDFWNDPLSGHIPRKTVVQMALGDCCLRLSFAVHRERNEELSGIGSIYQPLVAQCDQPVEHLLCSGPCSSARGPSEVIWQAMCFSDCGISMQSAGGRMADSASPLAAGRFGNELFGC